MAMHLAAIVLIAGGLLWACRFVSRRSRFAGLMFTAGVCIRASGAAFFLLVSYFNLPVLANLQMGNGFWTLAPDAREYYRLASLVAEGGRETITHGYVGPLALWMRAAGVNPASPLLFSLVMYGLAVVMFVAAFGQLRTRTAQRALHLGVAALSFSPMFVYAGVFGLKDVFFTTLLVMLAVAYLALVGAAWARETRKTNLLAVAGVVLAVGLIAGIRAYFAILLWAAIALTYAGCVVTGIPSRRRAAVQAAVVLPALALLISLGAEGNYPRFVRSLIVSPREVLEQHGGLDELDRRREGIDDYGGNSMLRRRAGTAGRLEGLAIGLGAMVVPHSILGRLGVDLQIGRSARLFADADTVVFDVTTVLIFWFMIRNRRQLYLPALLFGLALAMLAALPLAYVMTNYGTLIRLRLLVAVPIWLLTLALAPGLTARASPDPPAPSQSHGGRSARSELR